MVAGYATFIQDPQFNLAKALIAVFGTVNTLIILFQMYLVYGSVTETLTDDYAVAVDEEFLLSSEKNLLRTPLLGKRERQYSESFAASESSDTHT